MILCLVIIFGMSLLLLPTTKLGQGDIFTGICDSIHRGGLPWGMLGYQTIPPGTRQAPPWTRQVSPRTRQAPPRTRQAPPPHPLRPGTPPNRQAPLLGPGSHPPSGSRAYWEIRSTSGRYASCWNAILY